MATAIEFPTLYKLTKTGALQYWKISVHGNEIRTEFGQQGTLRPQVGRDFVNEGKNIGKANETTREQQAEMEARSAWTKQVDQNGYVTDPAAASRGERSNDVPVPMLAHVFEKHGHKLSYPVWTQPKLDGIRCLIRKENGRARLYSRKGKPFTGLPHLEEALSGFDFQDIEFLDGELYNHEFHDNFEHITHLVKQHKPAPGHQDVQFHVFDAVYNRKLPFETRWSLLGKSGVFDLPHVVQVETQRAATKDGVDRMYDVFADLGYEGVMVRCPRSNYDHSRSYGLLKYKQMLDAEYEIVDVVEGRGKLAGHGIFTCRTEGGDLFNVKMKGDTDQLRDYLSNPQHYIGKLLTVQYQGISNKNQVPRFPVGLRLKEDHE